MARKVFISFLGTNNYVKCIYDINGVKSKPTRFVQEALVEHFCKDWTKDDKIFIFCTTKNKENGENGSKETNWLDNGQARIEDESERIGLEHVFKDLNLTAEIQQYDIEAGFSEEEIWSIFDTVYSKLERGDRIFFDVTHAFRSIPLFSTVLFNYAKFMMDTHLESIMYGAFEKLGPQYKVKLMPVEKRIAPVIDITNVAYLQSYNQMASDLKMFGKMGQLKESLENEEGAEAGSTIKNLADAISKLDEYIETINILEIKKGRFIQKFRSNYKNIRRKKKLVKPIIMILDELNKETEGFVDHESWTNVEKAIEWTLNHDMIMQTYPLAEEYIIHRLAEKYKRLKPKDLKDKGFRMIFSSLLGMPDNEFEFRDWKNNLSKYSVVANKLADEELIYLLRPEYEPIRQLRNSLAHGNGGVKYDDFKNPNNTEKIKKCIEILNS